jgi:hypothetical protein
MSTLLSRLEVTKFADELGTGEDDLEFLAEGTPDEVRKLRSLVTHARFARHEHRLSRLANLTKLAPAPLAARIAESALGAEVSARVATMIDPAEAGKLTKHLGPEFLTDVSVSLDPERSAAVITSLPEQLIVDVGKRLVARGEYVVLARFVATYSPELALRAIEAATPDELLTIAIFAENLTALNAVSARYTDEQVTSIVDAGLAHDRDDDLVALLSFLSPENRARFVPAVLAHAESARLSSRAAELGYPDLLG